MEQSFDPASPAAPIEGSDESFHNDPTLAEESSAEHEHDGWNVETSWEADGGWYDEVPLLEFEEFERKSPFALHLLGGIRQGTGERSNEFGSAQTEQTEREYYALASLEVPLALLAPGEKGRAPSAIPRPPSRGEKARLSQGTVPADRKLHEDAKSESQEVALPGPGASEWEGSSAPSTESVEANLGADAGGSTPREDRTAARKARTTGGALSTSHAYLRLVREVARQVARTGTSERARLQRVIRRSRLSGLVPELRLRGVLGFDSATSTEDATGIYPGETTVRGGTDSLAEARLTFRLDRLVLGDGEASLERQHAQLAKQRSDLVMEAIELLSAWRVSMSAQSDEALLPDERLAASVRAEASMAQLFVLTGGWFAGEVTLREMDIELPVLHLSE